jgi:hypothetical protein
MDWLRLSLAALAVWRVSHLLAHEDGPWDVLARLRGSLGQTVLGDLMDCFYCLSIWSAFLLALLVASGWKDILLATLALSGAACLLERWAPQLPVISRSH